MRYIDLTVTNALMTSLIANVTSAQEPQTRAVKDTIPQGTTGAVRLFMVAW